MGLLAEVRDADGYTEAIRRRIVEQALTNVRARGIEPAPEVVTIYAQYTAGSISRQQASQLMHARLDLPYERAIASLRRGQVAANLESWQPPAATRPAGQEVVTA